MSEVAIPLAMDELERQLTSHSLPADLLQPLRSLQRLGLSKSDLKVIVERLRVTNEVGEDSPRTEDNCILALDIISGQGHLSLRWDASETAQVALPRLLDEASITAGLPHALLPSDLLPPRALYEVDDNFRDRLTNQLLHNLREYTFALSRADFYRVPKAGVTTRPAALLAPSDRLLYEALAQGVIGQLDAQLPDEVLWPRSRSAADISQYGQAPSGWDASYVVVADIESFYESIDHTLLGTVLGGHLHMTALYCQAVESFLTTVMGIQVGLPQGPPGSDLLASAYLSPVDAYLTAQRWTWVRFADDYLIAADSVVDGKRKIEALESLLREFGLRLSSDKSRVLRRRTYLSARDEVPRRIKRLQDRLLDLALENMREMEDEESIIEALRKEGVEEQRLFDAFYHNTISIDEVIAEVRDRLRPSLVEAYSIHLHRLARSLREKDLPENMSSAEKDLRNCLIYLAGAGHVITVEDLDASLRWFPRLAPVVSGYLKAIFPKAPALPRLFLQRWLSPPVDIDWVTAWLCHVMEVRPTLLEGDLLQAVQRLAEGEYRGGLLTQSSSVRALAEADILPEALWEAFLERLTPAMRSEVLLAHAARPDRTTRDIDLGMLSLAQVTDTYAPNNAGRSIDRGES